MKHISNLYIIVIAILLGCIIFKPKDKVVFKELRVVDTVYVDKTDTLLVYQKEISCDTLYVTDTSIVTIEQPKFIYQSIPLKVPTKESKNVDFELGVGLKNKNGKTSPSVNAKVRYKF